MTKKTKKVKSWSLVSALEDIWKKADDSELNEEYFDSIKESADYVKKVLGISPMQAFIISVLLDNDDPLTPRQIGHYAQVSNISMMTHQSDFNELYNRKFIVKELFYYHGDKTLGWNIAKGLVEAIRDDKEYTPKMECDYTANDVLRKMGRLLKTCDSDNSLYDEIVKEIRTLIENTQHIAFSNQLLKLELGDRELLMLLIAAFMQAMKGCRCISPHQYDDILDGAPDSHGFIRSINNGENQLVKLNLLENDITDGVADPEEFRLTEYARKTLMQEFEFETDTDNDVNVRLIKPETVTAKELYYNKCEQQQVERLAKLLSPESFVEVQERLKNAGMRPGFACLFYGSPGTGKTETVLQLCRQTGRPLMQVNVSELKSKWVGDSEKNIQALFNDYARLVEKNKVTPILLFNEADAILGKRRVGAESAVEKMENSIQNIILQEMEKLKGILIATTNLTENLDNAFERRFLYKIRFEKPGTEVKTRIWRSMLPALNEADASSLASRYDFSGGQIENIARKQTVDSILYDKPVCLENLDSLCKEESITNRKSLSNRKPIGFGC